MIYQPYEIEIALAGIPFHLNLQHLSAYRYFEAYEQQYPALGLNGTNRVSLSDDDWTHLLEHGFAKCGQSEASYMAALCGDILLKNSRCIVHAASFRDENRAWIIAANPGVGKSTQIRMLDTLFPGRYQVICGDRPVLEMYSDGTVMVHPSPWNGKENWGGAAAAPLAGIICLKRGKENIVRRMSVKEAVIPVFQSVIQTASNAEQIRLCAAGVDFLVSNIPIWEFINQDIPDSTRLLYETVLSEVSNEL